MSLAGGVLEGPAFLGEGIVLPRVDLILAGEIRWLLMNSPDHISDFIRRTGGWGATEATICNVFLQGLDRPVVIDIGANIGGFSVPVGRNLMRQGGTIHCVEPQRVVFQQLCANLFINGIGNAYTHNIALADVVGSVRIPELDFARSQNIGGLSIDEEIRQKVEGDAALGTDFRNVDQDGLDGYTVPKVPLDSLSLFERVAFVKVDVEGYELEVFRGCVATLEENDFPPVVFELWQDKPWYAEKARDTTIFIQSLGYRLENFGREVLAQHPLHPSQVAVSRSGDNASLTLQR